jgi:hypothetical protein
MRRYGFRVERLRIERLRLRGVGLRGFGFATTHDYDSRPTIKRPKGADDPPSSII